MQIDTLVVDIHSASDDAIGPQQLSPLALRRIGGWRSAGKYLELGQVRISEAEAPPWQSSTRAGTLRSQEIDL